MIKNFLVLFFAFALVGTVSAQQASSDLKKKQSEIQKEIDDLRRSLDETKKYKKEGLAKYNLVQKKIRLREKQIGNINQQINYIQGDINQSGREISKLHRELDTLKMQYEKSVVYSYKNRSNYDFLNFLFSSSSFNDAIKRVTYLKSYRTYREMQGDNILRTQNLLHLRINELSGNKQKKNIALQEKSKEMSELEKQQKEKQDIVNKLKGRQKELTAQINNKKKQDAKLKSLIAIMIKREIENARKRAEAEKLAAAKANPDTKASNAATKATTRPSKTTASVLVSSEADRVLDASFERNRGSLPWPTNGVVTIHYGRYTIPDTKIVADNPGVTIGTQIGAPVKSVFKGEVTLVTYIEDKQAVFIKHGKYFTVYSNLSSVSVQRGQKVETGEVIGKAGANDDGQGEVSLILMKETSNVNPELWLHK